MKPSRAMFDLGAPVALVAALGVVFLADRFVDAPPPIVLDETGKPVGGGGAGKGSLIAAPNIYSLRTAENREEIVEQLGGSQISEQSVVEGLDWLARHQAQNGAWSEAYVGSRPETVCKREAPCQSAGQPFAVAQTGLALLAFQAGGHYSFNQAEHSNTVRRGLDWLVEKQRDNGGIFDVETGGQSGQYMYEHGIAAFALAEACAVALANGSRADPKHLEAAKRAIAFIEQEQHSDGGWRYESDRYAPSDTSVSGWQVLALKSAKQAQIPVGKHCVDEVQKYFESCLIPDQTGRTGYQPNAMATEATTGVGMLVRQFLLNQRDSPVIPLAANHLAEYAEQTWGQGPQNDTDYYLWYNCTLGMHQAGGEPWERWNNVVRDKVIGLQQHEGCERGSWPIDNHWGTAGGRVYTTALAVLTLEVYYRFANETQH